MAPQTRYCQVRAVYYDRPGFSGVVSFPDGNDGSVVLVSGAGGLFQDPSTGLTGFPEALGLFVEESCGEQYSVEWFDGPPPSAPVDIDSESRRLQPKMAPPTRDDLLDDGVSESDIPEIVATQRYLFHQKVWPYGLAPSPASGSEAMLERFRIEEGVTVSDDAPSDDAPADDAPTDDAPADDASETYYERRRRELLALSKGRGGSKPLKEICKSLGLSVSNSKKVMVDAILSEEFPLDHEGMKA